MSRQNWQLSRNNRLHFLARCSLLTSCPETEGILCRTYCWSCHRKGTRLYGRFPIVWVQAQLAGLFCAAPGGGSFCQVWHFIPENPSSFYSSIGSKVGCRVLCNCKSHMALRLMGHLNPTHNLSHNKTRIIFISLIWCYRKTSSVGITHVYSNQPTFSIKPHWKSLCLDQTEAAFVQEQAAQKNKVKPVKVFGWFLSWRWI